VLPEQAVRTALEGDIIAHMRNAAINKLHNRELAEELAHDAVVGALTKASQLRHPERVVQWIWGIFNHLMSFAIDEAIKRRARYAIEIDLRTLEGQNAIERNLDQAIERKRIERVMRTLPDQDRRILELAFVDGLHRTEICRRLALTATQERLRKSRAKARLRDMYQAEIQRHRHGLPR
jgi:RNA polymerase sigma-70 factor (ECF subfamily)